MRDPPRILAVDDVPENLEIVSMRLSAHGYEVVTAADGEEGLEKARALKPDLILLDIMMPKLDGIAVLKELKGDKSLDFIPVILLTAKSDRTDIVAGLDAGGDDYLTKPFDQGALVARVRSMLRIKALHDLVQDQARQLEKQTKELAAWNSTLEERVARQVGEIERISRLKRFLSPQIADVVAASGEAQSLLESHRREVTVLFCDLRGFTAFTELAEPEEVMKVLNEYHRALGSHIDRYEGTLERFAGDGMLTLFNDPLPCPDHAERAVRMALDMRASVGELAVIWRKRGHELGFGIGVALGYATLGRIGFERRFDYSAVGSVTNLASRLCDEARSGQILVETRVLNAVEDKFETRALPPMTLKGFRRPVDAYEIIRASAAIETA
ncbi:response regulator [Methylocapsa palsarum]|uniref:Response regulator receiver domain-containing protein n=1 Tax=Methylocapsa palsarum TaxID=1612308 RepID=A0A1I4CDA8_9HYPH|nr:response regulator [Methylocapsa palsarum]SFK78269.1 Response regulator receiver domain-containing protein [Methylocapsa palsarum]